MWVKTYTGDMYNMNKFDTVYFKNDDGVRHGLYASMGNRRIPLLEYVSLSNREFTQIAMKSIEEGLKRKLDLVDLSNICSQYEIL